MLAMQVADVLGDSDDPRWVHDLANRAATVDWQHPEHGGAMLCALFSLPEHLHQRVIARCASTERIQRLLATFPPELHPALAVTAMQNGRIVLSVPTTAPLLAALAHTTFPSPGLQDLRVSQVQRSQGCAQRGGSLPLAAAALLARAAAAHPSLTRLHLTGIQHPPQWLRTFAACLMPGSLPRLSHLSLRTHAHPGGCAAIAACLRRLPSLTALTLSLDLCTTEEPVSVTSYASLASRPVCLPRLRRLKYSEGCFSREEPAGRERSCAGPLLQLLSVPAVTHLSLSCESAGLQLKDVTAPIARCPALRSVEINAAQLMPKASEDVFAAAAADAPPLASLSMHSSCLESTLTIAASALATRSLTS